MLRGVTGPRLAGNAVTGNIWEWTTDYFAPHEADEAASSCCAPRNPRVTDAEQSLVAGEATPRRVIKGGSHLCAPNYCLRFRPSARQAEAIDTSTSHIGFRCIVNAPAEA